MSLRTRFRRPLFWSAVALLLSAAPAAAQPPSPLELARGLREHGYTDLALEYLKDIETKPLSPDDKAALSLEKAKALLDASEEEPDEGTRVGMVAVAKEGLNTFIITAPNHPRKSEGLLATAKLNALDAREQLNRARRIDIPPAGEDDVARDAAQEKQKAEAKKARPLFLLASKQYAEASGLLRGKLGEVADVNAKKALEREILDADLAAGINQFNTAETFMPITRQTVAEQEERNKYLEASKELFGKLDKGGASNRTVWVARAWIAEVTYEQNDFNTAAQMVTAILKANLLEAEDGKRLAKFFQLRRDFLAALGADVKKLTESERALFTWLQQYGNPRRPTPEVYAVRYYRARALHVLAESSIPRPAPPKDGKEPKEPPKAPAPAPTFGPTARAQFAEAERLYRGLAQTDHDYTARAAKYRMQVVRRLLGDADQPLSTYDTFEKAQMASLIQLGKLATAEQKKDAAQAEAARTAAVLLLERARELSTPADNQADVADVLIRLINFYRLSGQPYKAAVLGEHVSRTMPKMSGGKAAAAGLLGLVGYQMSAARLKADPTATEEEQGAVAELRKVDRQKAMALARFLDEKYPNDNATDAARFQLALMLNEDKLYAQAFDTTLKVRPTYQFINEVRLLEGYLAAQLISKDSPLDAAQKVEVFNRAKVDLAKASRPAPVALEAEVRAYVSARCRLAALMLSQGRVDPKAEEANPGYRQATAIGNEALAAIDTFECLKTDKKPNLDGLELKLLAQDIQARALFLQSKALIDAGKVDEAGQGLEPALAEINKDGSAVTEEMTKWAADTEAAQAVAVQRDKILRLAAGVDKTRIEVLMAGFRLRVAQNRANESEVMIALIGRVGGTIEGNLPVLEALGRETAAKMVAAKKAGKAKEAEQLGLGLGILLKKIQNVPNLSAPQLLFIGQMLSAVGQYDAAVEALKKVPEPDFKDWRKSPPDRMKPRAAELKKQMTDIETPVIAKLPAEDQAKAADPDGRKEVLKKVEMALMGPQREAYAAAKKELAELEKKIAEMPQGFEAKYGSQMAYYAPAQLSIAKTLREDKRFQASEALLNEILGTQDKPGWGSSRLYFRKELAALYEERAATVTTDLKLAGQEWGRALQVWQQLFGIAKTRLQKLAPVPKLPDNATEDQKADHKAKEDARKVEERKLKNEFADAFFEVVRCTVKANQQLRAAPALAPKLQKSFEDAAKNCADIEKQLPNLEDWDAEVQNRYVALLAETPAMLVEYKKLGGKVFLEKKPLDP
jgi:hypothetical protein